MMRKTTFLAVIAIAVVPPLAAAQPGGATEPPPVAPASAPAPVVPPSTGPCLQPPAPRSRRLRRRGPRAGMPNSTASTPSLRLRLLAARDPREHWLAAQFDLTDIESKVHSLELARVDAPDNRLYLASLAFACMQPTRPQLPACSAVDRLADWAIRDGGNGVPAFLLGYRALERGQPKAAVAYVEEAAAAPRFDDYWSQGPQQWWSYLSTYPLDIDPAARRRPPTTYAFEHDLGWTHALHVLCADPKGPRPSRCVSPARSSGQAMGERGATFALRRAGARVAEIDAADAASRAAAQALAASDARGERGLHDRRTGLRHAPSSRPIRSVRDARRPSNSRRGSARRRRSAKSPPCERRKSPRPTRR